MALVERLRERLTDAEDSTVSDSFGGVALGGRAPDFGLNAITTWLLSQTEEFPEDPLAIAIAPLRPLFNDRLKYVIGCLLRFAFIIELTNLGITSTKMKTRFILGRIIKTMPGTFQNYEGNFSPGEDERAASFESCLQVFYRAIQLLISSPRHIEVVKELSQQTKRSVSYEFVMTYVDPTLNPLHVEDNVRLVNVNDVLWLIKARPLFNNVISQKSRDKIKTKAYKTDRSQTGEVQTNRAKRWECLAMDFQHATIEECWSVERKLLETLAYFRGFPVAERERLTRQGLLVPGTVARCPVTLQELDFAVFEALSAHGESLTQVGHLEPLKTGGAHAGGNIAWITADGNRIQGDMPLDAVHALIRDISVRLALNAPLR